VANPFELPAEIDDNAVRRHPAARAGVRLPTLAAPAEPATAPHALCAGLTGDDRMRRSPPTSGRCGQL
jgi:hypothetical protein